MSNRAFCKTIEDIEKSLNTFLGEHTIHATDRSKHIVWNYDDRDNKKTISIVFSEVTNIENNIKIEYTLLNGYVLVVPSYWVNVPRALAIEYLLSLIVDYYGQELSIEYDKEDKDNSSCGCPWIHNWKPCAVNKRPTPVN